MAKGGMERLAGHVPTQPHAAARAERLHGQSLERTGREELLEAVDRRAKALLHASEGAADQKTLPLRQMHLRMRRFNDTVKYVAHHLDVLWLPCVAKPDCPSLIALFLEQRYLCIMTLQNCARRIVPGHSCKQLVEFPLPTKQSSISAGCVLCGSET